MNNCWQTGNWSSFSERYNVYIEAKELNGKKVWNIYRPAPEGFNLGLTLYTSRNFESVYSAQLWVEKWCPKNIKTQAIK